MKTILFLFSMSFLTFGISGQQGWNWPEGDDELLRMAKEQQAFYKVNIQLDSNELALKSLHWLYLNNPKLHQSIYKDGVKVIEEILKTDISEERREALEDTLLWTFDQRILYFKEGGAPLDRKAYTAFKIYYKDPSKYELLDQLFSNAMEANLNLTSSFVLTPYMTLAKYYYKSDPSKMPAEKVLEIHAMISSALDYQISHGVGNIEKLRKEQDKADALLSSIGDILSCDFIENSLVPKFEVSPDDFNLAKKIFSYSLKAKCSDQPYFVSAGAVIYKNDPSFSLAIALGSKYSAGGDLTKALEYFRSASDLAVSDEERYEALINQAQTYSKMGNKPNARRLALDALSIKPGDTKGYDLIGNLYFSSYEDCKAGESQTVDRAVFIAAYVMYQKSGNEEQMAAAKAQFPSVEEIFNEGYQKGDEIDIQCWINESVLLMTRD